jgi:hypothetical protein
MDAKVRDPDLRCMIPRSHSPELAWRHRVVAICLLAAGSLCAGHPVSAQHPDLTLSQAERDSILAHYHNRFPIWGRKAIEKGFELPAPAGLSLTVVFLDQAIDITSLELSTGSNPLVPIDFVTFESTRSTVLTENLRADLWVLPFLNVYGFGGWAQASTEVTLAEPVTFTSKVDQTGVYWGLGLTATMGIKRNWLALDVNWAWTDLEKLDMPVRSRITGIRYGRAFKIGPGRRVAPWLGAMHQKLTSGTQGSIPLSEVMTPPTAQRLGAQLRGYQTSPWYLQLTPAQRAVVDGIAGRIDRPDGPSLDSVVVNYGLAKAVATPWNMLAGITYDFTRYWTIRAELGFIERTSILVMGNYRFDF